MKTAVVTGGTRGIGLAVSLLLAERGYAVYATYASDEASARRAAERGINVRRADVSDEAATRALFASLPRVDILVNNAGISLFKQVQDTSLAEWNRVFAVNAAGTFLATRCAVEKMLGRGGAIVNVSSIWGERGGSCESAYSASKAAILGFTKALAKELGASGIRVNAVVPGAVDTAMNDRLTAEEKAAFSAEIPLGRFASPEEIAAAVLSLAENPYCNGTILNVDGGY